MTTKRYSSQLPNPFIFADGAPVKSKEQWPRRRKQILEQLVDVEYGGLPPSAEHVECDTLYLKQAQCGQISDQGTFRITARSTKPFSFTFQVFAPPKSAPCPIIITGDGCWRYAGNAIEQILSRGFAIAIFNRVEIVADIKENNINNHLHKNYAEGKYAALAAWAWGYHRCIDALQYLQLDFIDLNKIVVTGHSRGGKAALLAGATDQRIAVTAPNNSGCGGAGCFKFSPPDAEKIEQIVSGFPHWFNPEFNQYIGKENELPFDQHFLKAAVAPRALLTTEALADTWANPSGTWLTHKAASEVYKFLEAENKIAIYFRKGGHKQGPDDWQTLLDFCDYQFNGIKPAYEFNVNPFNNLPQAFSWSAPGKST